MLNDIFVDLRGQTAESRTSYGVNLPVLYLAYAKCLQKKLYMQKACKKHLHGFLCNKSVKVMSALDFCLLYSSFFFPAFWIIPIICPEMTTVQSEYAIFRTGI